MSASRRLLTALVVIVAVTAQAGAQAPPTKKTEDPIQTEQRKLRQTEEKLKEERRKVAEARAKETSLLAELDQVEQRLADKQRDIGRIDARIKKAQADVVGVRTEIQGLERQRASQEQALARRLRAVYKVHAQGGALPLLFGGDDPVARAVAVRHLTSLATLDARLIQEYRGTSDRLDDRRRREEARQRELADLRSDAQREQTEVDRDAATRRTLLARVRDERAYHERAIGELTEATKRLEVFIRDLQAKQRRLARVPPAKPGTESPGVGFGSLRGRLPWPTEGRIIAAYGV
jgi:septal ring factor EnvC (AmiA/AmiB activator)